MVARIRKFDGLKYELKKEQLTSKLNAWIEAEKYRQRGYGARIITMIGEVRGRKVYYVYKSIKKL